jgi:sialidase-1
MAGRTANLVRRSARLVLPLLILLTLAPDARGAETVLVEAGVPVNVVTRGDPWTTADGALVSGPRGSVLLGGVALGEGDFRVRAMLAITDLHGSAVSVVFDERSHFGFSGRAGRMFVEGPLFGGRTRLLDASPVREGVPFQLVLRRVGGVLTVSIDDREVFVTGIEPGSLGTIGFRPWRSNVALHEFMVDGDTMPAANVTALTDVFVSGRDGYACFRIPSVIRAPSGDLLAFCEGRVNTCRDNGDIDLVMRRSQDDGRTWGDLQVVWDDGANTCGNPCPVVDARTGRILLLMTHNIGSDHESHIARGRAAGTRTVWIAESDDDGATWTTPRDLTREAKDFDWGWYATGPGVGIQLRGGLHAGRLVVPCDHSYAAPAADRSLHDAGYGSHVIFSDDGGRTWSRSEPIRPRVNECQVVELPAGRLLLNMRNQRDTNRRAVAISDDGGRTWTPPRDDETLIEPRCQASILRLSWPGQRQSDPGRIVFANPASTRRDTMTVRLSEDDGETWPYSRIVYPGGAAYSCLVALPDRVVGLLFERDGYRRISFARLELASLFAEDAAR